MNRITPIILEWNCYNGFVFHLFDIDFDYIEGSLFGINASREFLYVDIFWINIGVFDKTPKLPF